MKPYKSKKPAIDFTTITPFRDALYQWTRKWKSIGSDYYITGLLMPPRAIQLSQRYADAIDQLPFTHESIEKVLKAYKGTAIHKQLEIDLKRYASKHPEKGYRVEHRVFDRILNRKITGRLDVLLKDVLYDFKTTSTWKHIFNNWDDAEAQLNMYDYLLAKDGLEVNMLMIIAWYMDWDWEKQWRNPDYPKSEIEQIHITNKWPKSEQKDFIESRISVHKKNEDRSDDELDFCTSVEMWEKPTVYPVMRPGQDRAVRVAGMTSKKKAEEYIRNSKQKDKDTFTIGCRPGQRTKCEQFCEAAPWCNQYREWKAKQEASDDDKASISES